MTQASKGEIVRLAMDGLKPVEPAVAEGQDSPRKLDAVWADDIELRVDEPGLVDGLLPRSAMTVLYGESGTGKTFTVVDIACHVAAGRPWRGMDVDQGVVVYVAAEAPASVEKRVWAWKKRHGVERLPVLVVRSNINLLDGDTDALLALLTDVRERHGKIALVVVDTLACSMIGNENAPEDMGAFTAACKRIKERARTHVLVVHHSGKDASRGARGHSSLRAAADVELEVSGSDGTGSIRVAKERDEAAGKVYGFRLDLVELGHNAKGRMVTTCVAVEAEPPAGKASRKGPKGANECLVYDAMLKALHHSEETAPPSVPAPPNAKVARVARWKDEAMRLLPHDEAKRKSEAFNRAMSSLVGRGVVHHLDGWAWL